MRITSQENNPPRSYPGWASSKRPEESKHERDVRKMVYCHCELVVVFGELEARGYGPGVGIADDDFQWWEFPGLDFVCD